MRPRHRTRMGGHQRSQVGEERKRYADSDSSHFDLFSTASTHKRHCAVISWLEPRLSTPSFLEGAVRLARYRGCIPRTILDDLHDAGHVLLCAALKDAVLQDKARRLAHPHGDAE